MTMHDGTALEALKVDELELDEIEEEPPPTDPCPVVKTTDVQRIDNPEDDLETRLAWLAAEVRSTSAQQAQKKRAESVLEAREYKTALVPTSKESPKDVDLPKVSFAAGVDSQREPTQITKRPSMHEGAHEWEFDTADPEELSRTLPLDPNASIPDPLPFDAPRAPKPLSRNRWLIALLGIAGGIFLGTLAYPAVIHSLLRPKYAAIPHLNRGVKEAAYKAEAVYGALEHYEEGVHSVLTSVSSVSSESRSAGISGFPAPNASNGEYMKPMTSAQSKPHPSSNIIVPAPAPRKTEKKSGIIMSPLDRR